MLTIDTGYLDCEILTQTLVCPEVLGRVPQETDKVSCPDGVGVIAGRSETPSDWRVGVLLINGGLWIGWERETELIEAAGERELIERNRRDEETGEAHKADPGGYKKT
jgi:hypothetical protein